MGNQYTDPSTGEVMEREPEAGQAADVSAMLVSAMSRNERLLSRQDKLLDDAERMRREIARLTALYDEKKAAFHKGLAAAQRGFELLKRDNSAKFQTLKGGEYEATTASMEAAVVAVGDTLNTNGIAVRQPVIDHPTDRNLSIVRTILSCDGYEEHHDLSIVSAYAQSSREKGDMKRFGADVSLVRKYALFAALGLVQEVKEQKEQRGRSGGGPRSAPPAYGNGRPAQQHASRQGASSAAPAQHSPSAESHGAAPGALVHPSLQAATTIQELSKAMNALSPDDRKRYGQYFNQRRMDLQVAA